MRIAAMFYSLLALVPLTAQSPAAAQEVSFPSGPSYLLTQGSPLFARPIAPPSMSLQTILEEPTEHDGSEPSREVSPLATAAPDQLPQVDFVYMYYGAPLVIPDLVHEYELEPTTPRDLPASILEGGVSQVRDSNSASELDLTLAEASTNSKGRKSVPIRTYTNQDIERLRQGS